MNNFNKAGDDDYFMIFNQKRPKIINESMKLL